MFYKWTAFSYTPWIILPVVLGMLCTMLMYNENQYDMLKQLWIVPVNKMAYFFSKFAVVLVYSICFMLGHRNGVHSDRRTIRLYSL